MPNSDAFGAGSPGREAWSLDHGRALLRDAFAEGDALAPLYVAMLTLGLRPREALTLPWDCTDERSVLLPASRLNSSLVTMPLGRGTAAILEQHWQAAPDGSDLVFTASSGAPLTVALVHRRLQRRCRAVSIPPCNLIGIRNSLAGWLKSLGVSDIEVAVFLRLGPFSIEFEQLHQVAQLLDDALFAGLTLDPSDV
jgi:integrase